jgi:anti-anti-sigma regulatory factor
MSVRIETTSEDSETIVSVAGRLEGSATQEFLMACRSTKNEFVLDLSGLRSADSEGIEAIRELVRAGRKLRGVSPFIRLMLDDKPSAE